jgi:heme exporter protein D
MNWSDFFYMGGYAFEVWTSWGLTLLVLFAFVIIPKRRNAKIRSQIKRQISREQRQSKGESS